jgi:hypothetical protein
VLRRRAGVIIQRAQEVRRAGSSIHAVIEVAAGDGRLDGRDVIERACMFIEQRVGKAVHYPVFLIQQRHQAGEGAADAVLVVIGAIRERLGLAHQEAELRIGQGGHVRHAAPGEAQTGLVPGLGKQLAHAAAGAVQPTGAGADQGGAIAAVVAGAPPGFQHATSI